MPEQRTRVLPPTGRNRPPRMSDMDELEKAGVTIPASEDGQNQSGRVPPAIRKMNAQYEAVDMTTAAARMRQRQLGELPPIAGGLDGPGEVDPGKAIRYRGANPAEFQEVMRHESDDPNRVAGEPDVSGPPARPPQDAASLGAMLSSLIATEFDKRSAQLTPHQQVVGKMRIDTAGEIDAFNPPGHVAGPHQTAVDGRIYRPQQTTAGSVDTWQQGIPTAVPQPSQAPTPDYGLPTWTVAAQPESGVQAYLAQRGRVSFTVEGGTYSVPAIDVQPCATGLVILLPTTDQSATFIPSLGAEVTVAYKDKSWPCFFPGVAAHLDALNVQVLGFVFQNEV